MKYREFIAVLEHHGFREVRQRGSHHIYQRKEKGRTWVVPVAYSKLGDGVKPGTLVGMIRLSGLPKSRFR